MAGAQGKAKAEKSESLFVTAPLVQVVSEDGKPVRLMFGDLVTDNITAESVDNLKSLGYLSDKNPLDATADSDD